MKVIHSISEMRANLRDSKFAARQNQVEEESHVPLRVGYVPTMGALHAGHLSLVEAAKADNDITVVSIFVNPIQFSEGEDFDKYPQTLDADCVLLEAAGVDFVFAPNVHEMYPKGFSTYVDMYADEDGNSITEIMCGASRENHFRGVQTVVSKFFNILNPDRAYFGLKDFQQLAVIKKMVADLNFDIEIVGCPIVREEDGLAMSSRNIYLSEDNRANATILHQALLATKDYIKNRLANGEIIGEAGAVRTMVDHIMSQPGARIEYAVARDADNLHKFSADTKNMMCAVAVRFGDTRLIDNIVFAI
ncbi:MAG: pantoate--beta-alanine ligase [Clostridiales Family XIII bacterium]|jgi:pantoate--beta-alanine ligase|nr:pantoate--beta-alanine ligase [Clostridiales Family XIII bacterium]